MAVIALIVAFATGTPGPITVALALLGAAYAVLIVIDSPPLDGRAAVVGAALLGIGELAHLSLQALEAVPGGAEVRARQIAFIALLSLLALLLGGVLLALVDVARTNGLAIEAVGAAAALAAVGLLVAAARGARTDPVGARQVSPQQDRSSPR